MTKIPGLVHKIESLTSPSCLRSLFGNFDSIHVNPVKTNGYSGAKFSTISLKTNGQIVKKLFLKTVNLSEDWFAARTRDRSGREAKAILAQEINAIHSIFSCPYQLIAIEENKIGLLMNDLQDRLYPDERKTIPEEDQDLMLDSLAKMHASFWDSTLTDQLEWLHTMEDFLYIMGPLGHQVSADQLTDGIQKAVIHGWNSTLPLLTNRVKEALMRHPREIVEDWSHLPKTLIHGDTKVANFAKPINNQLTLLDWAFIGYAPCTFEIGWFIAVNASRLANSKEMVLSKYRKSLEKHLGYQLEESLWRDLEEAGIVCGALMLLWSKGNSYVNNKAGASEEWSWWMDRLEKWASR